MVASAVAGRDRIGRCEQPQGTISVSVEASVFDRVLRRMRDLVRADDYVLTVHGPDEMEADGLTVLDVEQCIFTGEISGRQRDRRTGEWKYLLSGATLSGSRAVVVSKIGRPGALVIITVYLE